MRKMLDFPGDPPKNMIWRNGPFTSGIWGGESAHPLRASAQGRRAVAARGAGLTCLETSCPFLYCTVPFSAKT